MSLLQGSELQSSVYLCTFECLIRQAQIMIKFPCSYFVEWTTPASKTLSSTPKHKPEQSHVYFNERLSLATEMIYSHKAQQYTKKESTVQLFLVSKSRPEQNKLVGRVTIDLSKIVNVGMYAEPTEFRLNFCSVQGSITMQFALVEQKLTNIKVQDLDRSSFIDYISQISLKQKNGPIALRNQDNPLKQTVSINKDRSYVRTSLEREVETGSILYPAKPPPTPNHLPTNSKLLESINDQTKINPKHQLPNLSGINKRITFAAYDDKQAALATLKSASQNKPRSTVPNNEELKKTKRFDFKDEVKEPELNIERCQSQHDNKSVPYVQAEEINEKIIPKTSEPSGNAEDRTEINGQIIVRKDRRLISIQQSLLQEKRKEIQQDNLLKLKLESSQELQRVREEYEQRQSNLQQTNKNLTVQLQEKNKMISQLEAILQRNDKEYQQLREVADELERRNAQLIHKNDEDKNQVAKMIDSYQTQIAQLNSNLVDYEERVALYEEKFANLEQIIKNLEDLNQKYTLQLTQSQEHQLSLQNQLASLQENNRQLQGRLETRHQSVSQPAEEKEKRVSEQQQLWQGALQQVQLKNRQLQQEMQVLLGQYEKKQQQYDNLNARYEELLQNYQATQRMQPQQEFPANNLAQEIICLSNQISSLSEQICRLNGQIDSFNEEKINLTQETDKLKEQLAFAQEQAARMNAEIQFLKMSLEMNEKQYTDQIQQLKINLGLLEQKLQQSQLKASDLHPNSTCVQNPNPPESAFQAKLIESQQEQITLISKIEEVTVALEEATAQNQELAQQNATLSQAIIAYEKQVSELKDEIDRTKHEAEKDTIKVRQPEQSQKQQQLHQKCVEYEAMIERLNSNLQEQINQNNQLSQIVIKYMQKEAKMKETLTILEEESKEIFVLFQQKEHNEETYQTMIDNLQREIDRMKNNFNQIHSEEPSPTKIIYRSPKESIKSSAILEDERDDTIKSLRAKNQQLSQQLEKLKKDHSTLMEIIQQLSSLKEEYEHLKFQLEFQLKNEQELKDNYESMLNECRAEIQKITQQLIQKTNLCSEFQKNIDALSSQKASQEREQVRILKQKNLQILQAKRIVDQELQQLKGQIEFVEEEKFGLQSENNEKDIRIVELQEEIKQLAIQLQLLQTNSSLAQPHSLDKKDQMYHSFVSIRDRLLSSSIHTEWEALMKNILDRSLGGQEAAKIINIEEKSRLLSKQLQKLKAHILKSTSRNQQEKLAFMKDIKGCESIISQLIAAAQALNLNQSSFL